VSNSSDWLPSLIELSDYGGRWDAYESAVYQTFRHDFIDSQPTFQGKNVGTRIHPKHKNKEYAFWHLIQEGNIEEERTPDLRRCERIGWIRAIIEHVNDPDVKVWDNTRGKDHRTLLWLEELDFLVILGWRRQGYWMLITAYPTDRNHTRRKLLKEYNSCKKS